MQGVRKNITPVPLKKLPPDEKEKKKLRKKRKRNAIAALLIFFLLHFPTSAHHIILEEIREMASSLSNIHVIILVNISVLDRAANIFHSQITDFRWRYDTVHASIDKTLSLTPDSEDKRSLLHSIDYQHRLQEDLLSTSEAEVNELLALLDRLRGSLPRVNKALAMSDPTSFRIKRGLAAILL